MDPLFSIVIANYNYGRFLEEAIRSVLAQIGEGANQVRPGEVELIIIDGGSSDNSVDVIKKYAGSLPPGQLSSKLYPLSSITYWISEKDKGQSDAFNKGFAKARGRFLTWLNADDVMLPGALAAVKREIERHPEAEWITGSSLWTDENLRVKRCFCAHRFSTLRARCGGLSVGGPSSFFTKRLFDSVDGVDVQLHYMMDVDLWHRFYRQAGARYVRTRQTLFACRQHEASKTSGADVCHTPLALENRRRTAEEGRRISMRHGRPRRFARVLTLSVVDNVIAWWRTCAWKGRVANEI